MVYETKKKLLEIRMYEIADTLNLQKTTVHNVILKYIEDCKIRLYRGERLVFPGLVVIEPKPILYDYDETLALSCNRIAKGLGIGNFTAYSIIREYLDSIEEDLLCGRSTNIYTIVKMNPILGCDGEKQVHSAISTSISEYMKFNQASVESVRVHTHQCLKTTIKEGITNDR